MCHPRSGWKDGKTTGVNKLVSTALQPTTRLLSLKRGKWKHANVLSLSHTWFNILSVFT